MILILRTQGQLHRQVYHRTLRPRLYPVPNLQQSSVAQAREHLLLSPQLKLSYPAAFAAKPSSNPYSFHTLVSATEHLNLADPNLWSPADTFHSTTVRRMWFGFGFDLRLGAAKDRSTGSTSASSAFLPSSTAARLILLPPNSEARSWSLVPSMICWLSMKTRIHTQETGPTQNMAHQLWENLPAKTSNRIWPMFTPTPAVVGWPNGLNQEPSL